MSRRRLKVSLIQPDMLLQPCGPAGGDQSWETAQFPRVIAGGANVKNNTFTRTLRLNAIRSARRHRCSLAASNRS